MYLPYKKTYTGMGVASLKLKGGGQLFKIEIHLFLMMVKN